MRLFLVKNNVPFDLAFAAPDHWVTAAYVTLAEFDGNHFDWDKMEFAKR